MPPIPEIEANGILVCPDVHLADRRPSRRKEGYRQQVFAKLDYVVDLGNDLGFVIVVLGDLLHWDNEKDTSLKTQLTRTLDRSEKIVHTNVGNHDMAGDVLADSDMLGLLTEHADPLKAHKTSGPGFVLKAGGRRVGVGFTPYGQEIPHDVTGMFGDVDSVVWFTHHDVGFEGSYPGALEPHAIKGCDLVVNGHMHLEKPPLEVGNTTWFNPGSLTRTAVDAIHHEPCVWSLVPGKGLTRYRVPHEPDVFDLQSRLVEEASPGEVVADIASRPSVVADALMAARRNSLPGETDEGVILYESLERKLDERGAKEALRSMVRDLHARAVAARAA